MNSASFVRKVNFRVPNNGSGFALVSAVFYEDEKRVYAFLTFRNNSASHVRGCTLRITPYDADRKPMTGFAARIDDLELPVNRELEYASPLLLPKDTFAFNWNFYEIEYSNPLKVKDTGTVVSNARLNQNVGNVSAEAQAEAEYEEANAVEEVAMSSELDDVIDKVRQIPFRKIKKKSSSKSVFAALFIALIVLLGLTAAFIALMCTMGGDFKSFLEHLTGTDENVLSFVNNIDLISSLEGIVRR